MVLNFPTYLKEIGNLLSIVHTAKSILKGEKDMRVTDVARKLTSELGIHVTVERIYRYEERGILPNPSKKEGRKDYAPQDLERVKKIVILSELGVPLKEVRSYIVGQKRMEKVDEFKKRIYQVGRLVEIARMLSWDNRKGGVAER